jgi:hypothetical protein
MKLYLFLYLCTKVFKVSSYDIMVIYMSTHIYDNIFVHNQV